MHLEHADDTQPGITRHAVAQGFAYTDADGKNISDKKSLNRFASLAIPPAYTNVWICPSPIGHLQYTGLDARKRKQYRYHPAWNALRDSAKYERLADFGHALPRMRAKIATHLALPRLSLQKVCAAVVALIDKTHMRIGNEAYANDNHSFGLTTFHHRHVAVIGSSIAFHFRGKSGVQHDTTLHNRTLSKIIRDCQEIDGHELFTYVDSAGKPHDITSTHVNAYIQLISNGDYTAKDFRTWHGSVLAASLLLSEARPAHDAAAKKCVVAAIKEVALSLGNTPAVCRKCYIHPAILSAYLDNGKHSPARAYRTLLRHSVRGLNAPEQHTLRFLERHLS